MFTPKQASIEKSFFRKERSFYSNWMQSFWRELVQNSIDAGAKNIDINIYDESAISTFNQPKQQSDKSTRIEFNDDGCGMSLDILENVYFKIGATSKNDESTIGGFGRARLITCFGAERYSIITRNNFVEGSGNLYECSTIEDSIIRKKEEIEYYKNIRDWNEVESHSILLHKLEKQSEIKGTHFTVDFDPEENPGRWDNPTSERMQNELYNYLFRSQINCNIFINGTQFTERLSKGTHIRTITAPNNEFEIGKLHLLKSGHSKKFGGELIFRIDGAPMLSRYIDGDMQAVFELNKENHRRVLTSNRDGFKEEFARPINSLIDEIVADNISALKDKTLNIDKTISGKRGDYEMKLDSSKINFTQLTELEKKEIQRVLSENIDQYERQLISDYNFTDNGTVAEDIGVIPAEAVNNLLDTIRDNENTFMDDFPNVKDWNFIKSEIHFSNNRNILSKMTHEMKKYMLAGLSTKTLSLMKESDTETNIQNVHIKIDNPDSDVKKVIKHFDPNNWSSESGKGKRIRMLLEAWTTACKEATYELLSNNIHMKPYQIRTGWLFTKPDRIWIGDMEKEYITEAMHQKNEDDVNLLLLNPVDKNGKLKYKLSDDRDLIKIINLAAHEVTHMAVGSRHNEEFASVYTSLISNIMPKTQIILQKIKFSMEQSKVTFDEDFQINSNHYKP